MVFLHLASLTAHSLYRFIWVTVRFSFFLLHVTDRPHAVCPLWMGSFGCCGGCNTWDNCAHNFAEFCLRLRDLVRCWTPSLLCVFSRGQVAWFPATTIPHSHWRGGGAQIVSLGLQENTPCFWVHVTIMRDDQQGLQRSCIVTIPKRLQILRFRCHHRSQEALYLSQFQLPVLKVRLLSPSGRTLVRGRHSWKNTLEALPGTCVGTCVGSALGLLVLR